MSSTPALPLFLAYLLMENNPPHNTKIKMKASNHQVSAHLDWSRAKPGPVLTVAGSSEVIACSQASPWASTLTVAFALCLLTLAPTEALEPPLHLGSTLINY